MLNLNEYQKCLRKVGLKFSNPNINWDSWHDQYVYYESMWENYFEFFLETASATENPEIKIELVFWESAPGGMPFPHQNYVFDSNRFGNPMHGTFDSYLRRVCNHFKIAWEDNGVKEKIGNVLKKLSEHRILIIDLYPTHGVSLDSTNRIHLFKNVFPFYSLNKLKFIGESIQAKSIEIDPTILVTPEVEGAGVTDDMKGDTKESIQKYLGLSKSPNFNLLPK